MTHLVEEFKKNFKVIQADTPELIEQSLALRYQVYCVEKAFEPSANFEDGKETDAYDARSVHSLVYHRGLERHVGSVRLVLPDPEAPQAPFPIECLCPTLRAPRVKASVAGAFRVAEISRFAISKQRRHGKPGRRNRVAPIAGPDNSLLPHATLALFAAIVRMSAHQGVTHWYALMEPTLARLLSRFGIYFETVGPMVRHRGRRQPVMGAIDTVLAKMYLERPDVWRLITDFGRHWALDEGLVEELRASASVRVGQGPGRAEARIGGEELRPLPAARPEHYMHAAYSVAKYTIAM